MGLDSTVFNLDLLIEGMRTVVEKREAEMLSLAKISTNEWFTGEQLASGLERHAETLKSAVANYRQAKEQLDVLIANNPAEDEDVQNRAELLASGRVPPAPDDDEEMEDEDGRWDGTDGGEPPPVTVSEDDIPF